MIRPSRSTCKRFTTTSTTNNNGLPSESEPRQTHFKLMNFDTDEGKIGWALSLWGNYIETGNVNLSRNDAINSQQVELINNLEPDQAKFVTELRDLRQEITTGAVSLVRDAYDN